MPPPISRTTSLREALTNSYPEDESARFTYCAQRYSHQRHFIVCLVQQRWLLWIDELVLPSDDLESIERILGSGTLRVPLHDGWLGQAPRNMAARLEAIRQIATSQQEAGYHLPFFIIGENEGD